MYLIKKHTRMTYESIAYFLGKRDHSTAIHAVESVKDQLSYDRDFIKLVTLCDKIFLVPTDNCRQFPVSRVSPF
jgi:chromosomal replication initiation ATPase DnaA